MYRKWRRVFVYFFFQEAKIGETIKRKVRHKPLGQTMSLKTVVGK